MMKYLQKLGKAFMLPVATLPLAGLLLGIGYAIDPVGWGSESIIAMFMVKAGAAILDNLGLVFAIGVGLGLSKENDGTGALASLVAFLIMLNLLNEGTASGIANLLGKELSEWELAGFSKVNNGNVFYGIIAGILGSVNYNKFKDCKLPAWLSFFSGKRCVAIVTGGMAVVLSVVLFFIWPLIYSGLVGFGNAVSSTGVIGAGLYGFFNRLLIPTGLHHALNQVFWFDLVGINDLGNFWSATAPEGDWGLYMAGFFPIMMFGLPAACLAMYHEAKPEKKKVVGSLMLAAGICSFVTGATEPVEFAFMFAAPVLYLIHAILTGVSLVVVGLIGARAGFNFSAGAIDLILSWNTPHAVTPWMLIIVGLVFAAIYYVVFRFAIRKFNLKTPGREEEADDEEQQLVLANDNFTEVAAGILEGLGGKENIAEIDHCVTRLRLEIKDYLLVDEKKIKAAGGKGVLRPSKTSVQVIIGLQVQFVHDELKKLAK